MFLIVRNKHVIDETVVFYLKNIENFLGQLKYFMVN